MNRPHIIVDRLEPDELSNQAFAQKDLLSRPLDLPIGSNPADFVFQPVPQLRQTLRKLSVRSVVALIRGLLEARLAMTLFCDDGSTVIFRCARSALTPVFTRALREPWTRDPVPCT